MCTDFKMFKVKVPINFSGTQGFPARRDGRYKRKSLIDSKYYLIICKLNSETYYE
jgi:hypothetical protein